MKMVECPPLSAGPRFLSSARLARAGAGLKLVQIVNTKSDPGAGINKGDKRIKLIVPILPASAFTFTLASLLARVGRHRRRRPHREQPRLAHKPTIVS